MDLQVKNREVLGKKVKNLRKEGFIPGEVFGHGFENNHIKVEEKKFISIYKKAGKNTIINIEIEDGKKLPALIYGVQIHPISRKPVSVDFYRIREDEKITTQIPLVFEGEAPAEEEDLVVLTVLDEIEIESLPKDIPHEIKVDLSSVKGLDDKITIENLEIPEGVEVQIPEDTVIVSVSEKQEEVIDEVETSVSGLGEDLLGGNDEAKEDASEEAKDEDADASEGEEKEDIL